MILEKVYDDFIKHTKLTDSVYRSVFVKVSEVLERVQRIKIESISYLNNDTEEATVFDFTNLQEVPLFVAELFKNIFENFYELPKDITVTLKIQYDKTPYEIVSTGLKTSIPDQIKFIQEYKLYDMFVVNSKVVDIFNEFDKNFGFLNTFKNSGNEIFAPILKRFENTSAASQISDGELNEATFTNVKLIIEELTQKRDDALVTLRKLDNKKQDLIKNKNLIENDTKAYEYLLLEKTKLTVESDTLIKAKEDYILKLGEAGKILSGIEASLSDVSTLYEDGEQKDAELKFLSKKKVMFEREKSAIEASVKDISSLLEDISNRLRDIVDKISEIESYSSSDLSLINDEIKKIEIESDDLYAMLLGIDNELKQQKNLLTKNEINYEKGVSLDPGDSTLQNIENSNIIDHLSTPDQPTSVTTVSKYLRYYFSYYATVISDDLLSEGMSDPSIAQAIASKLVLCRIFGVYFAQIFSPVIFSDNRIAKILKITRDQ